MNRKYENTHCGNNGLCVTSPYIPLKYPKKNLSNKESNNILDREKQKAYKDISKYFIKKY